jgi:YD repeat-containing protein
VTDSYDGVSTTSFTSFDVMGRVLASTQQTGSQTFNFTYGYNYAGSLTSKKYPSGRTLTIGYDGANRQSSIYGTLNGQGTAYINSVGYAAHGGLAGYFMGNQLTPQQLYNNRLQMSSIAIRKSNDQNQLFLSGQRLGEHKQQRGEAVWEERVDYKS